MGRFAFTWSTSRRWLTAKPLASYVPAGHLQDMTFLVFVRKDIPCICSAGTLAWLSRTLAWHRKLSPDSLGADKKWIIMESYIIPCGDSGSMGLVLLELRVIPRIPVITLRPTQYGRHVPDAFSTAFCWMKMYELRLRFHWSLTIFQHWFR